MEHYINRVGKLLFILFTVVPVVEIALLVKIGGLIGLGPTVALVVLTGLAGAALARSEGSRVIREWQAAIGQGRLPAEGVLSGLLVLVGGVLLVTPGVLTDVLGFSLLIPPSRHLIAKRVRKAVASHFDVVAATSVGGGFASYAASGRGPAPSAGDEGEVVEGEVVPGPENSSDPDRARVIDVG